MTTTDINNPQHAKNRLIFSFEWQIESDRNVTADAAAAAVAVAAVVGGGDGATAVVRVAADVVSVAAAAVVATAFLKCAVDATVVSILLLLMSLPCCSWRYCC